MRFRFCGGSDCPDWLLAELHALSRLSSIRVRQLANHVVQAIESGEGKIDEEKLQKMMSDAKLDLSAIKASVSCLWFVLHSAARHGAIESALSSELQQLGLPREHSAAICKVFSEHNAAITETLKKQSLRVNKLKDVQITTPEDTVDCVQLQFKTSDDLINDKDKKSVERKINVPRDQLQVLVTELKKARALMEDL